MKKEKYVIGENDISIFNGSLVYNPEN